ncbi:ATP-binding cassette domain-containing protein [Aggregatilinea lenta]|uniref:ATP-binding cassette domain-containing protein n=1 Tax=Aggregatilinea lenta TaxID=913108 RepID=UPI0023B1AD9F|nr:ATP-binding cassette domain-containing protein [Aggregatilinea lenta]
MTMEEREVVLEAEDIVKQFPGVRANDNVNLTLRRGEILALLGENGAGKSTLMNVIYGLYRPDSGSIRVKGREMRFASPREAIHSGIGMVHQHFQLIPVMTVAENVVLGEEADVAYQGEEGSALHAVIEWLPSILIFLFAAIVGLAISGMGFDGILPTFETPEYALGGLVLGVVLALSVVHPKLARILWGIGWRVGLAFAGLWIAMQVGRVARVALIDVALRQEIEVVSEEEQVVDGQTVTVEVVTHERIEFDWRRAARDADDADTGMDGLLDAAQAAAAEYRDQGVPGSLLDAIDDAPPIAEALSLALLLFLFGAHSINSWRGVHATPRPISQIELGALALLAIGYVAVAWSDLGEVDAALQVILTALVAVGLSVVLWRLTRRRAALNEMTVTTASTFDSVVDVLLNTLHNLTQVRNERTAAQRVRDLSQRYGLEVDPDAVVEKLAVGTQQRVEIVKALYRQADILILDEPTAVLTPQEGRELFKIMRELAAQGVSIIFITHKLKEVFEVATNIVVMRGGQVVGTTTPDEATESSLAEMMVGREVILEVAKDAATPGEPVLEVEDLGAMNDRGVVALDGVSFDVCAGEVLGIAGVQGNGQTELVEVLTGLRDATGGTVNLLGVELQPDVQPTGGIWPRAAAFVIDMAIVSLLAYFVDYFVFYFGEGTFDRASTVTKVVTVLIGAAVVDALYFLGSWKVASKTIGMSFFSLEIATQDDHKPGTLPLAARYLILLVLRVLAVVPALISFVLALRDPQHSNWFDEMLGLRVIRRERITARRIKDIGTSHVPEDRLRHGLVKDYSVADNLVLNDYYNRPYAQEPDAVELPVALLSYALLFGAIVAVLTVLAVRFWDNTLWTALLDLYDVPEALRVIDVSTGMGGEQSAALQWPFIIGVLLLILSEVAFGAIAHVIALWVLGVGAVRGLFRALNRSIRRAIWRALGREGQPTEPEGGLLRNATAIRQHAVDLIERFDIRTPSPETDGGNLSGGNQQKLIVAREFSRRPRLLIAAQPTRGIDVGSIEFIHQQIIEQRDAGAAVLLVSAELDEIMALSDRIAVMYKGQIIDTVPAEQATREQLGLLMAGIHNGAQPAPGAA